MDLEAEGLREALDLIDDLDPDLDLDRVKTCSESP